MWKAGDCHFMKTVLTKGEGFSCPVLESKCLIFVKEVNICKETARVDKLKDEIHQISELTIGWSLNEGVKLLETLIMTMKRGETSQFDVSTSLSVTPNSLLNDSKDENAECIIILELKDFDDATPQWKLSDSEKYELALNHKNEGSKLFQDYNVQAAFFHYSLSTKYLISMCACGDETEFDNDKRGNLICICYLNLAACQLKYKNYESVITNCCKALNIDGRNVKALYRRATAYKELGRNSDARSDLLQAKKHEPKNRVIHELLQSITDVHS